MNIYIYIYIWSPFITVDLWYSRVRGIRPLQRPPLEQRAATTTEQHWSGPVLCATRHVVAPVPGQLNWACAWPCPCSQTWWHFWGRTSYTQNVCSLQCEGICEQNVRRSYSIETPPGAHKARIAPFPTLVVEGNEQTWRDGRRGRSHWYSGRSWLPPQLSHPTNHEGPTVTQKPWRKTWRTNCTSARPPLCHLLIGFSTGYVPGGKMTIFS